MSVFVRTSRLRTTLVLAGALFGAPASADTPQKVVSMNLCSDQLAMRIAAARYQTNLVRAKAIMSHPVVAALREGGETGGLTDHDWVCGTPFVVRAIEQITDLRGRPEERIP
jgi:hypothetical protein